jgi:SPP1 family predicted phage head-tail adaptor
VNLNEIRVQSGRLRQRVKLVLPGTSRDSFGGVSPSGGASLGPIWAEVVALSGRDSVAAQSFSSIATHKVTMRWMPNITAQYQVILGRRTFQIEAVLNPNEQTKVLHLLCVEVNDSKQQGA